MSASLKLRQVESKISTLQNQCQHHLKQRQQEIANLIAVLELASLDDTILTGGLLFLKEKITTKDPVISSWHTAGERFCRRAKPRKVTSPKKTPEPKMPDQPPPKHPESRAV